jgi:hypothetical protein
MIGVLACLAVSLVVFALAAAADKHWPDRLSRRGRRLAGLSDDPPRPNARPRGPAGRAQFLLERQVLRAI